MIRRILEIPILDLYILFRSSSAKYVQIFIQSRFFSHKADLRQQRKTARVFFSSPFGGLEEEREELTKKYWPRLSSICKRAGYEFVPVDMRWGITSEMSSNAATIEICVREMDRSDMIVDFFGQVKCTR